VSTSARTERVLGEPGAHVVQVSTVSAALTPGVERQDGHLADHAEDAVAVTAVGTVVDAAQAIPLQGLATAVAVGVQCGTVLVEHLHLGEGRTRDEHTHTLPQLRTLQLLEVGVGPTQTHGARESGQQTLGVGQLL